MQSQPARPKRPFFGGLFISFPHPQISQILRECSKPLLRQRSDINLNSWLALAKQSIIGLLYVNAQIVMSMPSFIRSAVVTEASREKNTNAVCHFCTISSRILYDRSGKRWPKMPNAWYGSQNLQLKPSESVSVLFFALHVQRPLLKVDFVNWREKFS